MSHVNRPIVPYKGSIIGGLHIGKRIKIRGQVPYGADRFTVNLQTGLDSHSDRPLHISVRFNGNIPVRNTLLNNSWGSEERNGPFPFAVGRNFTMGIRVENAAYKISVNGQDCYVYSHRIPFSRVNSIMIDGDISIERIEFINNMPTPVPATVSPPYNPAYTSSSGFQAVPLPCTFPIYGGIRPGMTIHISGRPTNSPQKFLINLQNGASTHPPPDIALQFDARFYKYYIVRNSRVNNMWGSEETTISHFPFQPGVHFDMIIKVQSDAYMVIINGQHFISFRHRLHTFSKFNILYIENDVIVSSVRYS